MGASASSMTKASVLVPSGPPDHEIGGLTPCPRQVYRRGIATPWPNSGLVTVMFSGSACCSAVGPASRPQPPSTKAAAAVVAIATARRAARLHRLKHNSSLNAPVGLGGRSYAAPPGQAKLRGEWPKGRTSAPPIPVANKYLAAGLKGEAAGLKGRTAGAQGRNYPAQGNVGIVSASRPYSEGARRGGVSQETRYGQA